MLFWWHLDSITRTQSKVGAKHLTLACQLGAQHTDTPPPPTHTHLDTYIINIIINIDIYNYQC